MAEFSLPKNSVVKKGVKHAPDWSRLWRGTASV